MMRRRFFPSSRRTTDRRSRSTGGIADEPEKVRALDEALIQIAYRHDLGGGIMEWEYLLLTACHH